MKNAAALVTLVGLLLDLVGAFLLAVEAIGLERIRSWQDRWVNGPVAVLSGDKEMDERAAIRAWAWLPGLFGTVASGAGAGAGTAVALALDTLGRSKWNGVVGAVLGGLVGFGAFPVAVRLFRSVSRLVDQIEESTKKKGAVGLIGFLLLAFGFVFQAVGTLVGVVR